LDVTYKAQPRGVMAGPETFWRAGEAPVAEIDAAFTGSVSNRPCVAQLVIRTTKNEQALTYPIKITPDGVSRTYRVRLDTQPEYAGAMKQVSLRFPESDGTARVRRISLLKEP